MKTKEKIERYEHEIEFWEHAKALIKDDYGADCPDFNMNCPSCEAGKIIEWIDKHLALTIVAKDY